jgi:hypothetical protein
MADGELRGLLDERGAWVLSERLRVAGLPARSEAALRRSTSWTRSSPRTTSTRCD